MQNYIVFGKRLFLKTKGAKQKCEEFVTEMYFKLFQIKGYGDTKIIPGVEAARLEELLKLSPAWEKLKPLWLNIADSLYDLSPGRTCLGYPPHGCTTYLSKNCTSEDNERVQNWMKSQQLQFYNNRLFKTESENQVFIAVFL